jgi:DNA-binding XRE family transcriptional regulator
MDSVKNLVFLYSTWLTSYPVLLSGIERYTFMDSYKKEVGKKLKEARESKNLTQSDLAKKADINVNYYARIERGEENPSLEVLQKLFKALNIKSSDILPF